MEQIQQRLGEILGDISQLYSNVQGLSKVMKNIVIQNIQKLYLDIHFWLLQHQQPVVCIPGKGEVIPTFVQMKLPLKG